MAPSNGHIVSDKVWRHRDVTVLNTSPIAAILCKNELPGLPPKSLWTCNSVIIYECMDFFGFQLPSILLSKRSTNFELKYRISGL